MRARILLAWLSDLRESSLRAMYAALFVACAGSLTVAVPAVHAQPFTFLQPGFAQVLFGHAPSFFGGVAIAPGGDVYTDECAFSGSPLFRFDLQSTITEFSTKNHPQVAGSPFSSDAGCGITNHPDATLYSNTSTGVTNLDANTAALIRTFGSPGNALGIAVDPQTKHLVYVAQDCRFTSTCTIISVDPVTTNGSNFAVLNASDADFVDGIAFDPTGNFLFLANRAPTFRLTVLNRAGAIVQHVAMTSEPDGISFHSVTPTFVVTDNTDGTMTRFDFPGGNFNNAPTQSLFASGGFRGDNSQVGADGCIYLAQDGTRFNDGTTSSDNSVVQVCGGFVPPPGECSLSPFNGDLKAHPATGVFYLYGVFKVSNGCSIDPPKHEVTFSVGDYSVDLPAGSLVKINGGYVYQKTVDGIFLCIFIRSTKTPGTYTLFVERKGGKLDINSSPVPVALGIGDTTGNAQMNVTFY